MSRYQQFDRSAIQLQDLKARGHELTAQDCRELAPPETPFLHPDFAQLIERIQAARNAQRPVVFMMGAHPIKLGLSRFLIDLIERKFITHLATNGAGLIHDYELAAAGGTSENVAKWIKVGQFGLWRETSQLNDVITEAARRGEGLGEGVGRAIEQSRFPYRDLSVAAAAWRVGIPLTAHVSIGSDITHSHANCDGAALGKSSLTDFLIFARTIQELERGVYLNFGSAVTGPEVFLKALSMARNVAHQEGRKIRQFATAVFDVARLTNDWKQGIPGKHDSLYFWRPLKTILIRTVADGGTSYFFEADHQQSIPALWHELVAGDLAASSAKGTKHENE